MLEAQRCWAEGCWATEDPMAGSCSLATVPPFGTCELEATAQTALTGRAGAGSPTPGWWALRRAVHHKCMSSLCSWCGQRSSSSLAAALPRSSMRWLACSSPDLLSAPAGAKPRCGSWLPNLPALPRPLSKQVPCHPSGLSAPQRVRGARQPRSIFRLWRIPLGSPF